MSDDFCHCHNRLLYTVSFDVNDNDDLNGVFIFH